MNLRFASRVGFLCFTTLIVGGSLAAGCAVTGDEDAEARTDDLWAALDTKWPASADGRTRIPVCWETSGFSREKEIVRSTVESSWSSVANVELTGWQACSATGGGLRIRVADEQPRVTMVNGKVLFGKDLKDVPGGLTLNFTWTSWGPFCSQTTQQRHVCIKGAAMHEIGHVLGFLHEQDRKDAPARCPNGELLRTDTDPSIGTNLGPYDPRSIMNYCNGALFTAPSLSAKDIEGAQKLYGVAVSNRGARDGGADASSGAQDGGAADPDPGKTCPGGCFGMAEGRCYKSPRTNGGKNYYVCKSGCLERVPFC